MARVQNHIDKAEVAGSSPASPIQAICSGFISLADRTVRGHACPMRPAAGPASSQPASRVRASTCSLLVRIADRLLGRDARLALELLDHPGVIAGKRRDRGQH